MSEVVHILQYYLARNEWIIPFYFKAQHGMKTHSGSQDVWEEADSAILKQEKNQRTE